jgi:hypothetical protein
VGVLEGARSCTGGNAPDKGEEYSTYRIVVGRESRLRYSKKTSCKNSLAYCCYKLR